ncbi:MAG: hypothetical protein RIT45_4397 [Pseudomonadota bacterium]|jgi:cysteine-rich repeat protein
MSKSSHRALIALFAVLAAAAGLPACSDDPANTGSTDVGGLDAGTYGTIFGDTGADTGVDSAVDAGCTTDAECADGNPCTDDFCKEGACTHPANKLDCDDGDPCTGGDRCNGGSCAAGTSNLCVDEPEIFESDTTDTTDTDTGDDTVAGPTLKAGDLVITEIHYNPAGKDTAVTDADGEWFEVYNASGVEVDLAGLLIHDDGNDKYNVLGGKTLVAAGAYFVFGRTLDTAVNGGVTVDHTYGNSISLTNSNDSIVLESNGVVIDKVAWDTKAGWPVLNGKAMQLSAEVTDATDNDNPAFWCAASEPMSSGDTGTPGKANSACPKNDKDKDGVPDSVDNCPDVPNPDQADADKNGQGDLCEDGIKPNCGDATKDDDEGCDDGNNTSGDGCDKFCEIESPIASGALVISEMLPNPATVTDANGEWFEIYNPGDAPVTLNGLTITVGTTSTFTIVVESLKPVVVAPKSYAVLGNNADASTNGGVTLTYAYDKLALSNNGTTLTLTSAGTAVDSVTYGDGWPLAGGKSLSLDPGSLDASANDALGAWCFGQAVFGAGDLGSPGQPNPTCAGSDQDADKDGIPDAKDNCPNKKNVFQEDGDKDGIGDACDNCVATPNADQADANKDGVGDACEKPYCGNGVVDGDDECDDANALPADGCSPMCKKEVPIGAGDLVVVELMIDTSATADDKGEWVELYNASTQTLDINGLELRNKTSVHVVMADKPLTLAPKTLLVMALSTDPQVNGGVTAAYGYSSVNLTNGGNQIRLVWAGKDVDVVGYEDGVLGWPPVVSGRSLQLSSDKLDATTNDLPGAWCLGKTPYGAGDKGTPGATNAVCAPDADQDEVPDSSDNCKDKPNPDQADSDKDGIGDACDNCKDVKNADQADSDKDGVGDACPNQPSAECGDGKTEGKEQCDDGGKVDGDGCSATCMVESPAQTGEVVITEMLTDPTAVSDAAGEWLELANTTTVTIDIAGWKLQDKDSDGGFTFPTTGKLEIPAGARVIVALNSDPKVNGGVDPLAGYGSKIALSNSSAGGRVALEKADGTLVDEVRWENNGKNGWPQKVAGVAFQLGNGSVSAIDNDIGGHWCLASKVFGAGDKGTPAALNDASCGAPPPPPPPSNGFNPQQWWAWPTDLWP